VKQLHQKRARGLRPGDKLVMPKRANPLYYETVTEARVVDPDIARNRVLVQTKVCGDTRSLLTIEADEIVDVLI